MQCTCLQLEAAEPTDRSVEAFFRLREQCAALNLVIIPDKVAALHRKACEGPPDKAHHQSIAYLAFRNGRLHELTGLVHRYCILNDVIHPRIKSQYRNDLAEKWILERSHCRRFKLANIYFGRISELAFLKWLEDEDWKLTSIEAHGGRYDAMAKNADSLEHIFEVKSIGHDKFLFDLEVDALNNGGVSVGSTSLYSPLDYLIVRIYDAATQLMEAPAPRIAVAVMADYSENYEMQLKENWIKWDNPAFFERDGDISGILADYRAKDSMFDDNVKRRIPALDEVWFFARRSVCELEFVAKRVLKR